MQNATVSLGVERYTRFCRSKDSHYSTIEVMGDERNGETGRRIRRAPSDDGPTMNFYNGYTPKERNKKLAALHRSYPNRSHPYYKPPCHFCGDPSAKVEPHSEDYAEPFRWERPAVYAVCSHCHSRLHSRFDSPTSWLAYKAHLRRGGFGSDLKTPLISREVTRLAKSFEVGHPSVLSLLPDRPTTTGSEWWEFLTTDARFRDQPIAKPR